MDAADLDKLSKEWKVEHVQFDEDSLTWINEEILKCILEKNLNERNVKVTKIEKRQAVMKGENYGSVPAKVLVVYNNEEESNKQLHLMIKSCPEVTIPLIKIMFEKEIFYYETIWPKIARILNLNDDFENPAYFAPRFFSGGPKISIIMNDLAERGYRNASRHSRLDFDHCKLVVQRLAELHAASIKMKQEDPELKESLSNPYDTENAFMSVFSKNAALILAKVILTWPGYENYSPRLEKLSETIWEKLQKIRLSNNGRITVMNHGDCWSNNILFHYPEESKSPDSVVLVDYQIAHWGSPVVDLFYFFYISSQLDVVMNKFETLIDYYLLEIQNTLKKINLPLSVFPEEDFRADLEDGFIFGFINSFTIQVISQAPKEEPIEMIQLINGEAFKENSQWRKILSTNKSLQEYIQKVLDQANAKGLF